MQTFFHGLLLKHYMERLSDLQQKSIQKIVAPNLLRLIGWLEFPFANLKTINQWFQPIILL